MAERFKTELIVAGALLCFGVLLLPFAIYFVGQQVVGEYRPGAIPMDFTGDLWTALGNGEPGAWALVVSPYVVVQLLRLTRVAWRARSTVSRVTDPQHEP